MRRGGGGHWFARRLERSTVKTRTEARGGSKGGRGGKREIGREVPREVRAASRAAFRAGTTASSRVAAQRWEEPVRILSPFQVTVMVEEGWMGGEELSMEEGGRFSRMRGAPGRA
jgi:hypothetical protein